MKLVSVQVGRPRTVRWHGKAVSTGIYKEPVAGRIMLHRLNLDGDQQADLTVHGGRDKAVYVYPSEHYPIWQAEFPDMPLPYGMFGENFTTEGAGRRVRPHRRSVPHRRSGGRGDAAAHALLQTRHTIRAS